MVNAWWRANRPGEAELFEHELRRARDRLVEQPDLGQLYQNLGERTVRRLLLPKTEQHLYYFVDSPADTLIVITIWGARRGRAPKL